MRVERLGQDKIRVFLSFDDLMERGIEKEDMWRDIPRVHQLFNEMMEQAYEELGFEVFGPVAVEVFALPAQGMVVVVTRSKSQEHDLDDDDALYALEVTLAESESVVFAFSHLEPLIQLAHRIEPLVVAEGGRVYAYNDSYYLVFDNGAGEEPFDNLLAVVSEYGELATVTEAVLVEYGKTVFATDGVRQLCQHFPL
ncbi:genetic competence negative regulator [Numidum massiliense]|uniref:genetic competence negative regulator n=1 Tax=Numidum massiliense TaxID=1522315 RepID=UPI0006D58358|nr:genetic competence negative regulator [Numidum massiliense]